MTTIKAPPRATWPVLDAWGAQIGTKPEPLGSWILRARVEVWRAEPKPTDLQIALGDEAYRELMTDPDLARYPELTASRRRIFGMAIDRDPAIPEWEIRFLTNAEWAEQRAKGLRAEWDRELLS